eukprot:Platyproteum_vivax@DN15890_c0_g1_i1.p1
MVSGQKAVKKELYFKKLIELCQTYPKVLVVHADHVGSKQMAAIRHTLRGKAVLLMGKNTSIRTCLRQHIEAMPQLEKLLPLIKLNIGLVFCIADPNEVREIILENKVPAPARVGAIAPLDVTVPAGPTGMDPSQTAFFQALGIATKIVKAQIEIQSNVQIIVKGEKVTASQSVLLQKLNILPFTYGLEVRQVYDDGSVYDASVLELSDDIMLEKFSEGVRNVAALSRAVGIPTQASVSHAIVEGFKNCAALIISSEYTFSQMEQLKKYLEDPSAFAFAVPAAGGGGGGGGGKSAAAAAPVKEEEPEEEEEEEMGFSLFD